MRPTDGLGDGHGRERPARPARAAGPGAGAWPSGSLRRMTAGVRRPQRPRHARVPRGIARPRLGVRPARGTSGHASRTSRRPPRTWTSHPRCGRSSRASCGPPCGLARGGSSVPGQSRRPIQPPHLVRARDRSPVGPRLPWSERRVHRRGAACASPGFPRQPTVQGARLRSHHAGAGATVPPPTRGGQTVLPGPTPTPPPVPRGQLAAGGIPIPPAASCRRRRGPRRPCQKRLRI